VSNDSALIWAIDKAENVRRNCPGAIMELAILVMDLFNAILTVFENCRSSRWVIRRMIVDETNSLCENSIFIKTLHVFVGGSGLNGS
jgi:hypothetical protein